MKNQPDDLFEEGLTVKTAFQPIKPLPYNCQQDCIHLQQLKQQTHDTCEIAFIYMQRHKHMSGMSLGQWFDNAHGLKDEDLHWAVTTLEAKRIIVKKGYNRLSLEPLMHYNAGIGKGE